MKSHIMKHMIGGHSIPAQQRGVSLVEALVALVVLSIGMLGIAALYVETMRANRTALTRMQAISLVNDMGDRIRANPRGRSSYNMANTATPTKRSCVSTNNCSAVWLAEDDLAWWVEAVGGTLPSVSQRTVVVTPLPNGLDSYRIRLQWSEPGETAPVTYDYENVFESLPVLP